MSLAAHIIDQQIDGIVDRHRALLRDRFGIRTDDACRSAAFVVLTVKTLLDLDEEEALDRLTEGGNDFGIDAIDFTAVGDSDLTVTLFQGKYKRALDGHSAFPRSGVEKMLLAIDCLFDPFRDLEGNLNQHLKGRIEELRSLISDGAIPQVRAVLCNNGEPWDQAAQRLIDGHPARGQISWSHTNHQLIFDVLSAPKTIDETLRLRGEALVESFDFRRVLVGRVAVSELATLFSKHGDRLLQRNIRRYLGLQGNRVNEGIAATLREEPGNFYFYNNGVTVTCRQFRANQLQTRDWPVKITDMQIINGGQTCRTIQQVLRQPDGAEVDASVMIRIYELSSDESGEDLIRQITYATNNQNPVDLRDLRSNDRLQRELMASIEQLGFSYRRQRTSSQSKSSEETITSATAAEAVLAVWRQKPHQAKFRRTEHFGALYDTIFDTELNGAQVVIAVLLHRYAERMRRRGDASEPFLQYASGFIAMVMGAQLLSSLGIALKELDHRRFAAAKELFDRERGAFHRSAVTRLREALHTLFDSPEKLAKQPLQKLAGTFRRGELIKLLIHPRPENARRTEGRRLSSKEKSSAVNDTAAAKTSASRTKTKAKTKAKAKTAVSKAKTKTAVSKARTESKASQVKSKAKAKVKATAPKKKTSGRVR